MRPPCREAVLHGVKVAIPADWDDWTLYRFAAPDAGADRLPPRLRVKPSLPGALHFRTNILVRRHPLTPPATPASILEASAAELLRQNPTCTVIAVGPGEYHGQAAACQDLTFMDASTHLQLFQRQLAMQNGAGEVVVLTLTTDRQELGEASPGFTFATRPR